MRLSLIIAACCLSLSAFTQNIYTLSGLVTDPERQKLAAGEVSLMNRGDTVILRKTFISAGEFIFDKLRAGEYTLYITAMGFVDKTLNATLDESKTLNIIVEHAAASLQEVFVLASQKSITIRDGNIVANIENSPLSAVTDPFDLLSKLPGVIASADGLSLNIVGKGTPLIYIDNQKAGIEELRSLAVSSIKTIEIINNPSAKYEAEGRAVIRITRKINDKEGWNTTLNQTAAYRRYFISRSQGDLNFRRKRLEIKSNIQYNYLKTWEGNAFDFDIASKNISSKYSVTAVTTRPQFIAAAGAFYQLNGEDYLSANISSRSAAETFPIYTNSMLQTPALTESVKTSNYSRQPVRYTTANFNYHNQLKKGSVFGGAQFTQSKKRLRNEIYNSIDNGVAERSQERNQNSIINALALRADMERKFAHDIRFESGISYTHAFSDGETRIDNYRQNENLRAEFRYVENNYAAYSQLSGKIKSATLSSGLRAELIDIESHNRDNVNVYARLTKNVQYFPKASVSVPLDSLLSLTVSYAKSIARPDYTNANPISVYINPYFEWANNIDLGPAITTEITARLQHKKLSLAISSYQTRGVVYDNFIFNEQETRLRRIEANYDRESGFSATATVPLIWKGWTSTNIISLIFNNVKDDEAVTDKLRPFMYAHTTNEFKLPNGYTFTITGWAVTKSYQGAYERNALFSLDTSVTKTIGKHLSCTFRFNDMFASINSKERFEINDVAASGIYYDRSREISVGLKYALGQLKESRFRNKDVDENTNRIR